MKRLHHWCITDKFPALYDTESATAIEMTAKVYGAMNELVDEYNKFVNNVNVEIEKFETSTEKDIELFKVAMRQEFQDFIDVVELKLKEQDKKIADAINVMVTNLQSSIDKAVNEYVENGVTVGMYYNETTEELSLNAVNVDSTGDILYIADEEKIDIL